MDKLLLDLPNEKRVVWEQLQELFRALVSGENDCTGDEWKPQEWRGHRFLPCFCPQTAKKYFEDVKIEENTVFLASFPKSGMNWMSEIINHILHGHDLTSMHAAQCIPPLLGMLELWKPEKLDLLEHIPLSRKLLTTHLTAELFDFEKIKKIGAKVVIPIRNPKDQACSWFHFSKTPMLNSVRDELHTEWPQFFLDYIQGKHPMITKVGEWYPDFLLGWYKYKNEDNVLFLYFEDVEKNPKAEIKKLAEFLEVHLTDERIADIVRKTSFDEMKKEQEAGDTVIARSRSVSKMIRKGQVGAWKNTFTVAQSEMMDSLMEEKLGHTDIKFCYE